MQTGQIVSTVREWVQTIVPSLNLLLILFGLIKVFNRHEAEWVEKEKRLANVETEVVGLKQMVIDMAALKVQLTELVSEIMRVRDRLDRFLDKQSARDDIRK